MLFFYLFALLPAAVGAGLWVMQKKVVWWEWLAGTAIAVVLSAIFHVTALVGMTTDHETWSGEIVKTTFYPRWVEEYEVAVYVTVTHTDSNGNTYTTQEFSHYETHYRTHHEYWTVDCTVNSEVRVPEDTHKFVALKFGNQVITTQPWKSGFYSGDRNVYHYENATGYIFPTTARRRFENRIKAAPSVFSFIEVPKEIQVFSYPSNKDFMQSDRLLGTARRNIDILEFDRLNSSLGWRKKVNLIMVGFPPGTSSQMADYQQAAWLGGKKNDLVLCYAGDKKVEWARVFGWTEEEIVKRNLETILLNNQIANEILALIQHEVEKSYRIKDWSKFDYITIEAPTSVKIIFIFVMIATQSVFYFWAHQNEESKGRRHANKSPFRYR